MSNDILNPQLHQRGRAEVDFMVNMFKGSVALRQKADADIKAAIGDSSALPDDMDARSEFIEPRISNSRPKRVTSLIGEWHARNHANVCERAFEDVFPSIKDGLASLDHGDAELFLDLDFKPPAYWDGVDYHRTEGGWDGHEYAGYVHAEIIHRKIVNETFPGGLFVPRRKIAARAPKESYDTILDMGCSTAHFTQALQETYPEAKITGVDLSARTLEHARRVANAHGWDWKLYQRAAEETGFEDECFDLVASYILLHEVPASAIEAIFAEAFRVLKPGGDIIMSDVTRFSDVDKLTAWKMDQGAKYGGEPHWRESASADLGAIAKKVGFINVSAAGDQPRSYPYVVQGRKP